MLNIQAIQRQSARIMTILEGNGTGVVPYLPTKVFNPRAVCNTVALLTLSCIYISEFRSRRPSALCQSTL
jgi:hypothetical protein